MNVIHHKLSNFVSESGYNNFTSHYVTVEGQETGSLWLQTTDSTQQELIALYVTSGSDDDMHELSIASIEAGYSASAGL